MGEITVLALAVLGCGLMFDNWRLRFRLNNTLTDLEDADAALKTANEQLKAAQHRNPLTSTAPKAQDKPKRFSGAELRRLNDLMNVTVPEPTQAERLETTNG